MLKTKLGIDQKDAMLLSIAMHHPEISQAELAKRLKLSQPSVNARLTKLKKKGVLSTITGIEITRNDMCFARVDFTATNASGILGELKNCSFFVNGFIMSGKNNASILVVAHDLKKIEAIIDRHLRSNPGVKDITMNVVVSATKPVVSPLDLLQEEHEECQNPEKCDGCKIGKVSLKVL